MSYKLICLDVDGTLLDDEKRVPESVKESLKRAHSRGIRIALITGRMPQVMQGHIFFLEKNASTAGIFPLRQGRESMRLFWLIITYLCGFSRGENGMLPVWILM